MIGGVKRKLGYDDLAHMPDDGLTREILDGELFVTPSPSPLHQRISKRLQRQIEAYFEDRGLGEVFNAPLDTILGPHDVAQPDVLVVTNSSLVTKRAIEGPPVLVVEILSPATAARDRAVKADRYAAAGVAHYWIVDPEARRLECLHLVNGRYVVASAGSGDDTLEDAAWPGLIVQLAELWR